MKNTHNASTFQPYDPSDTIGDTAPTAAKPPKKNKCGAFGQVMLVVVAMAVTAIAAPYLTGAISHLAGGSVVTAATASTAAVTAGTAHAAGMAALSAAFSTTATVTGLGVGAGIAAGAAAGAAGSIASQAVGIATGIQSKFSWNAVGVAAISGLVSGGSAAKFGAGKNALAAGIRGAANNVVSQGLSLALGMQSKFDWAGVATAGVSAGVGRFVSEKWLKFGYHENDAGKWVQDSGRNMTAIEGGVVGTASAIAATATRTAIAGGNFGDNFRAEIPNIIGNVIGTAMLNTLRECFVAGTPVHTPGGLRPIESLRAGDLVWSRHDGFGVRAVRARRIVQTFRTEDRATFRLTVQTADGRIETIRTTPAHPFAVMRRAMRSSAPPDGVVVTDLSALIWAEAQFLQAGDEIASRDGHPLRVLSAEADGETATVHNFEVEGDHTYFVGETGAWVHNESDRRSRIGAEDQPSEEEYLGNAKYNKVQTTNATLFGEPAQTAIVLSYPELGEDLELKLKEVYPDYENDYQRTRYKGFMNKTVPYETGEIAHLISDLSNYVDHHPTSWTVPFFEDLSARGRSYQLAAPDGRVFETTRFRGMEIQHQQKLAYMGEYLSQAFTPGGVAMGATALLGFDRDTQMAAGGVFNLVLAVASLRVSPNLKAAGLPAPNPPPLLPKFQPGDKTVGVLRTSIGDVPLSSGWAGPSSAIPRGSPGFDIVSKSHVEGHAAALMRQEGIKEATLFINNAPCRSCVPNLPRMLPSGATLNVVLPDGSIARYVGK
jgi:hypothetical protein